MSERALFLGGPWHGKHKELPEMPALYIVPEGGGWERYDESAPLQEEPIRFHYEKHPWLFAGKRLIVYTLSGTSAQERNDMFIDYALRFLCVKLGVDIEDAHT